VLVASVGLIDSLNPSTIAPALYLAAAGTARSVLAFAAGVFAVSAAGGLALVVGPGQALVHAIPRPGERTTQLLELAAGAVALAAALALWLARARVARRLRDAQAPPARSAFLVGAGIMAVELPTALPYFAALAAVVASHRPVASQVGLVLLFNAIFVLPLVAVAALRLAGRAAVRPLRRALERHGAQAVAALAAAVGVALLALGSGALAAGGPDGRTVFASACSGCHTLGGRGAALPGGDLGGYRLSAAEIASFAAIMPVHPRLSAAELGAVAAYVASRERATPPRQPAGGAASDRSRGAPRAAPRSRSRPSS
jgi:mono/diheme cytochrome c family protein